MPDQIQTTYPRPSPGAACSADLDAAINRAASVIIAGFAANGRKNPDWIAEAEYIIRREVITQLRESLTAMYRAECPEDVPNYWSAKSGWKRAIQDTLKLLPNSKILPT